MRGAGHSMVKSLLALVILALMAVGCAGKTPAAGGPKPDSLAKLKKIDIKDNEKSTIIIFVLEKPVTFTSVRVSDPPKMVLDLAGADLGGFNQFMDVKRGAVKYIAPLQVPNAKNIARVEIGLESEVDSRTVQDDSIINVIFEKPKGAPKAVEAPPAPEEKVKVAAAAGKGDAKSDGEKPVAQAKAEAKEDKKPEAPKVSVEVKPAGKAAEKPSEKPAEKAAEKPAKMVKDVTFARDGDAVAVRVEGDGAFLKADSFKLGTDRIVIDIPGVSSAKDKLTVDVGGKCLKKIRMARHQDPPKIRVVMDLGSPANYDVKNDGNSILVSVKPAAFKPAVKAAAAAAPAPAAKESAGAGDKKARPAEAVKETARQAAEPVAAAEKKAVAGDEPAGKKTPSGINVYVSKNDSKTILTSSPLEEALITSAGAQFRNFVETDTKIYTGGLISFDIQNAELDKVVKLLADVAGLNLIMDPADVRGTVTLKLDNVPWDQALDILLRLYNLDKRIEGNVMRVAAKVKLDDEKRRELQQAEEIKKLEERTEELVTRTFKINYTTAADLEPKVRKLLSPRGDATANPRTNELIINDIEASIRKAEELIKILDKGVNQIMIEARIVTVDIDYSQSLGLSWGLTRVPPNGDQPMARISTNGAGLEFDDKLDTFLITVPSELALSPFGGLGTSMVWNSIAKDLDLDLTLQALESIGKAEVLAAPKVFTLENQKAIINSGIQLYVQTTSASGTEPKALEAGLRLEVKPQVTGDNLITLDVKAMNNEPSIPPVGATAAINKKEITTNAIVRDGDTIVLGGIYYKKSGTSTDGVPLLSRIPLLGWLFKQRTKIERTNELLIFITPKITNI